MLTDQQLEILQRYHDNECSPPEQLEVEALLERSPEALDALARMDNLSDLYQRADDAMLARVSFDGLWENVQRGIQQQTPAVARPQPEQPEQGVLAWLKELFFGHKGAWITAASTAAAVALVLIVVGRSTPQVETVVEKHYIYIDAVNKADPQSTVVINSLQDEGSAVIWLLPNAGDTEDEATNRPQGEPAPAGATSNDDDERDVIIEEEPL